ncbi:hypothetical protein [Desertivirga arenae]|uniref:hypothetical protein n=1 Tax=Desertivirga arenae TaxID=2810309 RepID=UPI001A973124|nr:hypothetical protein [Pedobacter sp. SYSU D00823]
MKNIFKTLFCALAVSLTMAACSSNTKSEGESSETSTEANTGDTAVVMDNDSLSNPPTTVDSLNK